MSDIINLISIFLSLTFWILVLAMIIHSRYVTVKSVKAQVVDKYKPDTFSKYSKILKQESYIVVFETKDKKLLFYVSEFSYNSYTLNEKGTLKYRGNKIISFK